MNNLIEQARSQNKNIYKKSTASNDFETVLENSKETEETDLEKTENIKLQKLKLKVPFLTKLKKIAKYTAGSVVALAFTTHYAQKEYPDYLSHEKEPTKIEWSDSTKKEIKNLSHDYALIMKKDYFYKEIPNSVFENRFTNFVATYGPDIEIIRQGDDLSIEDKIVRWGNINILNRCDGSSRYYYGTIFMAGENLNKKVDSTGYNFQDNSLGHFLAELSHHLNDDYSLRRIFAYTENFFLHSFNQQKMYKDPYSIEYQAHKITLNAISKYIFPVDHNLNTDFVTIYNAQQKYYRKFLRSRPFHNRPDSKQNTPREKQCK